MREVEQQEEKMISIEKWLLTSKAEEKKAKDDIMKDIRKACEKRTSNRNNTNLVKQSWSWQVYLRQNILMKICRKYNCFKNPAMLREYAVSLIEIEGFVSGIWCLLRCIY